MKQIYRLWTTTNLITYRLRPYAILAAVLMISPAMAIDQAAYDAYTADLAPQITPAIKDACKAALVNSLDDPSSFQVAGEWYVTSRSAESAKTIHADALLIIPARSKNKFGGLVRMDGLCYLSKTDGVLSPLMVTTADADTYEVKHPFLLGK